MNSCDQKDGKKITAQPFTSPQCRITMIRSRGLFPKSKKGKEKRRYSLLVF